MKRGGGLDSGCGARNIWSSPTDLAKISLVHEISKGGGMCQATRLDDSGRVGKDVDALAAWLAL